MMSEESSEVNSEDGAGPSSMCLTFLSVSGNLEGNILTKCRLCLSDFIVDDQSLFKEQSSGSLATQIKILFGIELESSLDFPSFACGNCIETLGTIHRFQDTILSSDTALRDHLKAKPNCRKSRSENKLSPWRFPRSNTEIQELEQFLFKSDLLKCPKCAVKHTSLPELTAHMEGEHDGPEINVTCCSSIFQDPYDLLDHAELHLYPERFKCHVCEEPFTDRRSMYKHLLALHREVRFKCHQCEYTTSLSKHLKIHVLAHFPREDRPLNCPKCDKRFTSRGNMKKHIHTVHDRQPRHLCLTCGKTFPILDRLKDHEKIHLGTKDGESKYSLGGIKCKDCNTWQRNIVLHWRYKHRTEFVPSGDDLDMLACAKCDKEVVRYKMPQHEYNFHVKKPFLCNICGMKCRTNMQHEVHMDKHLNRTYPCPCCEKVNVSSQGRILHIKAHHPEHYEANFKKKKRYRDGIVGNETE